MRNRYLRFENLQKRELFAADLQAAADLVDTNQDGTVSHLDLLYVINSINAGQSVLSQPSGDVNQNGRIEHLDLLAVINYLNYKTTEEKAETLQIQTAVLSEFLETNNWATPWLVGIRRTNAPEELRDIRNYAGITEYGKALLRDGYDELPEQLRQQLSTELDARLLRFEDVEVVESSARVKQTSEWIQFISLNDSYSRNEDGSIITSFYTGGIVPLTGEMFYAATLRKAGDQWEVTEIRVIAVS